MLTQHVQWGGCKLGREGTFSFPWLPVPGEVKKTLEENRNWEIRFVQDNVSESWLEDITSLICHMRGLLALFPYSSHAGRIAKSWSISYESFWSQGCFCGSPFLFSSPWAMHRTYLGISDVIKAQMCTAEQWALKVPGFMAALKPQPWVSWKEKDEIGRDYLGLLKQLRKWLAKQRSIYIGIAR